jgi:hypothetical protein
MVAGIVPSLNPRFHWTLAGPVTFALSKHLPNLGFQILDQRPGC